jgi:hypothetical protein
MIGGDMEYFFVRALLRRGNNNKYSAMLTNALNEIR